MLDTTHIEEFKKILITEKTRIEHVLSNNGVKDADIPENYRTSYPEYGEDGESNAIEVSDYEDTVAVEHTLEETLLTIDRALERIDKGTYGICEQCGQEIPFERLKALPAAFVCANHL
ncbi:MAG TPA: TraR/DksA C4-type zinc finger protein [Patescibacteria group bacterium]|nr:TraR/DksA C4-type zinc finger protein [Patescibacteria group bacterium]